MWIEWYEKAQKICSQARLHRDQDTGCIGTVSLGVFGFGSMNELNWKAQKICSLKTTAQGPIP